MKAICVTPGRTLEVRDIPTPNEPAPGHVLVDMDASRHDVCGPSVRCPPN